MATFSNPRETWNERYSEPDYLFGEAPNEFVRNAARFLAAGQSVLCVADGEGRNSVWLAEQGMEVAAFDFASNAVEKARRLAAARNVRVDHRLDDLMTWDFVPDQYDALVVIFIQFLGPEERSSAFGRTSTSDVNRSSVGRTAVSRTPRSTMNLR